MIDPVLNVGLLALHSSQYTQLAQKGNFEKDPLTLASGSQIYLKL